MRIRRRHRLLTQPRLQPWALTRGPQPPGHSPDTFRAPLYRPFAVTPSLTELRLRALQLALEPQ